MSNSQDNGACLQSVGLFVMILTLVTLVNGVSLEEARVEEWEAKKAIKQLPLLLKEAHEFRPAWKATQTDDPRFIAVDEYYKAKCQKARQAFNAYRDYWEKLDTKTQATWPTPQHFIPAGKYEEDFLRDLLLPPSP